MTLENSGFCVENAPEKKLEKATIIVLGPGRSGTSLVANLLNLSEINMGSFTSATAEDLDIAKLLKNSDYEGLKNFCLEKSSENRFWGWKRPETINHLENIENKTINPVYICLFRDVFAIAKRNEISIGRDISSGIHSSLRSYLRLNDFLKKSDAPRVMISFEKLNNKKQILFDSLSEIINLEYKISDKDLEKLTALKEKYLSTSKN